MSTPLLPLLAALAAAPSAHVPETEDWLGLDREVESLRASAALQDEPHALGLSGFVRTSFAWNSDLDVAGFSIDNLFLDLRTSVADFDLVLQYEAGARPTGNPIVGGFGGGTAPEGVLDAYGSWSATDQLTLTAGQFRPAVLHFARSIEEDGNFFSGRSVSEAVWSFRDQGVELSGHIEQLGFWAGIQNGADLTADRLAFYGRVAYASAGELGRVQGALDSGDELRFQVGGAVYDDDSLADGTVWALDAVATMGMFAVWGDLVRYDRSMTLSGDTETTWSVAGTVLFVPETWEAGLRIEGLQDLLGPGSDANVITLGLNYYLAGHSAKLGADLAIFTTDVAGGDSETLTVGTTLGW